MLEKLKNKLNSEEKGSKKNIENIVVFIIILIITIIVINAIWNGDKQKEDNKIQTSQYKQLVETDTTDNQVANTRN